jgi:hypothetical protein
MPDTETHIIAKSHGSADEDVRVEFHVDVKQKTPGFELVVDRLMRLRGQLLFKLRETYGRSSLAQTRGKMGG